MFCTKCGQQNDGDSKFCQNCGAPLSKIQTDIGKTLKRRILFIAIVTVISLIILTIAISVIVKFFFRGPGGERSGLDIVVATGDIQTIKSKLTEVTNDMSMVASGVAAFKQEGNPWPNFPTITEIQTSLGVNLRNAKFISNMNINNGVITTIVSGIDRSVDGRGLILTPALKKDGSIIWRWSGANGMPEKFVPKK